MGGRGKYLGSGYEVRRKIQKIELKNLAEDKRRGIERRIQDYKKIPFRKIDDELNALITIDGDGYIDVDENKLISGNLDEWFNSNEKKKLSNEEWDIYRAGAFNDPDVNLRELEDAMGDDGAVSDGNKAQFDWEGLEDVMNEKRNMSYDESISRLGQTIEDGVETDSGPWAGDLEWLNKFVEKK